MPLYREFNDKPTEHSKRSAKVADLLPSKRFINTCISIAGLATLVLLVATYSMMVTHNAEVRRNPYPSLGNIPGNIQATLSSDYVKAEVTTTTSPVFSPDFTQRMKACRKMKDVSANASSTDSVEVALSDNFDIIAEAIRTNNRQLLPCAFVLQTLPYQRGLAFIDSGRTLPDPQFSNIRTTARTSDPNDQDQQISVAFGLSFGNESPTPMFMTLVLQDGRWMVNAADADAAWFYAGYLYPG